MALTRYQFVDGKYRIVHEKHPRRKPGPKPKPKKKKKQGRRREMCPGCGRTVPVLVLIGWRGLRYVNHYRQSGGQCSKAMEPYEG